MFSHLNMRINKSIFVCSYFIKVINLGTNYIVNNSSDDS